MDQQSATSITHFPAVTLANNNTWLRPARSLRVSWQRFHRSHSQLGRCSSIREPCVSRGCSFLLRARAGLLLMLLVRLLLRTLLLPRLLCHHRLPPDARTGGGSSSSNGSSILASVCSVCTTLGRAGRRFLPPPLTLKNDGASTSIHSGFLGPRNHPPDCQMLCLAVRVSQEL